MVNGAAFSFWVLSILPDRSVLSVNRVIIARFERRCNIIFEFFAEKMKNELDKHGKRDYITGYSIEKEYKMCSGGGMADALA